MSYLLMGFLVWILLLVLGGPGLFLVTLLLALYCEQSAAPKG